MDRHRPRSPLGPDPPGVGGTGPSAVPPSPDMRARPGLPSTHHKNREFFLSISARTHNNICSNIESAGARRGEVVGHRGGPAEDSHRSSTPWYPRAVLRSLESGLIAAI